MINLSRSCLILLTYPNYNVDWRTVQYFFKRGMRVENFAIANNNLAVAEARNFIWKELVAPHTKGNIEWFIFMDQDNYPIEGQTDPFLDDVDYDIVGAEYDTGNQAAWKTPEVFHMGCVRVRTSFADKLQLPLFKFQQNADGTKVETCECGYFKKRAEDKGATITRRGFVGHGRTGSWKGDVLTSCQS